MEQNKRIMHKKSHKAANFTGFHRIVFGNSHLLLGFIETGEKQ